MIRVMDSTVTTLLLERVLIAGVLGALIGAERDFTGRPAGIRTNLIIAVGSCLFTVLSVIVFGGMGSDPARLAAQVVTGAGFLGAGALIHQQNQVLGLTTAADMWLVAAIGMSVGTGYYALAMAVTVFTVLSILVLSPVATSSCAPGRSTEQKLNADLARVIAVCLREKIGKPSDKLVRIIRYADVHFMY